ncbi:MAG: TolC family protein, partial [Bacteroidales bacterium]|nr:TolC family protein [Bacteroidales bacterium]
MRKMMFAAALLAAGVLTAAAQQRAWTLRECIDYALEHNISVRQSGLGVEQKEVDLNSAISRRLPGVSASASENLSFGRGLTADNTYSNANTTSTSFSLGADIPIFQGFD